MKDKIFIGIASITAIVIFALIVVWLLSLSAVQIEEQKPTTLIIEGLDAIEVGGRTSYALTMEGVLCYAGFPQVDWKIDQGQIMNQDGPEVTLMAHQPGKIVLTATFSGMTTQKEIQVHPKANIALGMKTWIHPGQWYATGIESSGTTEASLALYRVLETGRRVDVSSGTWEAYSADEIMIRENGNYLLIAESNALSDGRKINTTKSLTVTPYVQRGYHVFSWDNENLVQLTPADHLAIRFFLEQELGIEVNLFPGGRLRDANRVSTDYVFYKDSSRKDTIIYQTGVEAQGQNVKKVWQSSVKGADIRPWYICWDDFIITANRNDPGLKMSYRDSGSGSSGGGSSGGGGPSPSPSIGGPSPSPSI